MGSIEAKPGGTLDRSGTSDGPSDKQPDRPSDKPSALRVFGVGLYNLWILVVFYNDYLYLRADDLRGAMYASLFISLVFLIGTIVLAPRFLPRADKMVLSKRIIYPSGVVLALSTVAFALCDTTPGLGWALVVFGGVASGVSSGLLLLGWARLFSDVGTRPAMIEISLSWVFAALLVLLLIYTARVVSAVACVVAGVASAVMLREAALVRPTRPKPSRQHRLHTRTKRMFARGLVACFAMGLVQGFTDVIAGFRFFDVPQLHPVFLMVGCAAVALAIAVVVRFSRHDFVCIAYRVVAMVIVLGCLLMSSPAFPHTVGSAVIFGAYQGFFILLCTVCIDISNYFDVRATRAFGMAIGVLYLGEALGDVIGFFVTFNIQASDLSLQVVSIVLTVLVVFAVLFLFTEKDLVETSLGEMLDEEPELERQRALLAASGAVGANGVGLANGGSGGGGGVPGGAQAYEERIARVTEHLGRVYQLTPRECEVLPLVIKGRTIARIQEELHISQGTVSTHTRHIYQKTQVVNRQGLLDLIDTIPDSELEARG